jgi:phosphate transport system substrate-binding protein
VSQAAVPDRKPRYRSYFIVSLLLFWLGIPLSTLAIALVGLVISSMPDVDATFLPNLDEWLSYFAMGWAAMAILGLVFVACWGLARVAKGLTWGKALLPGVIAYAYYGLAWVICYGVSGYDRDGATLAMLLSLPWVVLGFMATFSGDYHWFPFTVLAIQGVLLLVPAFIAAKQKAARGSKGLLAGMLATVLILPGIAGYQEWSLRQVLLDDDYNIDKVTDDLDLWDYYPFSAHEPPYLNPKLKTVSDPTLTISSDYPILDGATAFYPVYAAIVQNLYSAQFASSDAALDFATRYADCSRTTEAYANLVGDRVDAIFALQPSSGQYEGAKNAGKEYALTPIAKEAFVFFVNAENPVTGLTSQQVRDIYTKKITNWSELGGSNSDIMAFQRPEDSGSQTIMLAEVMGDTPMATPLMEEVAAGMSGVIDQVAGYRNYSGAIGYSFRWYATEMDPNPRIKLLAIDGVAPTPENIRNGSYPFTVDVNIVTAGSTNPHLEALIDWTLSPQGQKLIEDVGYVGINS